MTTPSTSRQKPTNDVASDATMAWVWMRFIEIYAHKWASQHGEKYTETWAFGLFGLTRNQIAAGFRWCVKRPDPWPPSLPEFRAACLAESVEGYPRLTEAYRQGMAYAGAVHFGAEIPDTLPGIREACRQASSRALVSLQEDKSRELFRHHYEQVLVALAKGEIFPEAPRRALEKPVQTSSPGEVSAWCAQFRAALQPRPSQPATRPEDRTSPTAQETAP